MSLGDCSVGDDFSILSSFSDDELHNNELQNNNKSPQGFRYIISLNIEYCPCCESATIAVTADISYMIYMIHMH